MQNKPSLFDRMLVEKTDDGISVSDNPFVIKTIFIIGLSVAAIVLIADALRTDVNPILHYANYGFCGLVVLGALLGLNVRVTTFDARKELVCIHDRPLLLFNRKRVYAFETIDALMLCKRHRVNLFYYSPELAIKRRWRYVPIFRTGSGSKEQVRQVLELICVVMKRDVNEKWYYY